MAETAFALEASFDRKGRVAVAYLHEREGKRAETREIAHGSVNADYDADGALLAVEFYGRCSLGVLSAIGAREPDELRRILASAGARGTVLPAGVAAARA